MKKILALSIMIGLILFTMPLVSIAQEQSKEPIQLEKAIEIAKSFFQIPQTYDQFDSSYEQDEFTNVWSLSWYSDKGDGRVRVMVDADSGEIAGYYAYDPQDDEEKYSSIPKISRKDGEKIALDFIKKVAPSKASQIILKPNNQSYYGTSVFHDYIFYRTINGIEYPSNNIHVEISGQTGQVRDFSVNWENTNLTPIIPKLTRQDAEKIFSEQFGFELKYFQPETTGKTGKPIMAVYEINNPDQITIDATTGEIVQDDYYEPYYDKENMMGGGDAEDAPKAKLEPFEQEVADEIKGLISRENALEIAQKAVNVTDKFKLTSSRLNSYWDFPELRMWSFRWELELEEEKYYGYASAEVDAQTGKVLSFNYKEDNEDEDENSIKYKSLKIRSKSEAEKLVNSYLQANYPEVIGNIRLQSSNPIKPKVDEDENNQPRYSFRYERLVNGIPFSQNYIRATVGSYTGKISSFRIRFVDLYFPKTDNVIDKAQLTTDFFAKNQMILVYTKDQDDQLRLVYKLAPLESYRFNAQTGQMMGYDGEPVKAAEITDIKGHWAEPYINTLNQMGLLHYENSIFQPDAEITQAEVIKALVKSTNRYLTDSKEGNWYDIYYRQAKQSGLITEKEINPKASATREELAKFITRTMMADKLATLQIYKVDFQDKAKISPGYTGYVAIVSGLGIITGDGSNFNPKEKTLRGEACAIIVRYLKTEK